MSAENTYIVVGLGNPGAKYENTRHNVGFMVADYLAQKSDVTITTEKWFSYSAKARLFGKTVYFVKPDTFMNLSGKSVAKFLDFYKSSPGNLLVIHDDIDMNPGRLKLTVGGGAGGHNGIKSIIQSIGSKDFFRLKFGIGRPGVGDVPSEMPVDKFVLAPFSKYENDLVADRLITIEEGIRYFLENDSAQAQNILNSVK